MTDSMSDEEIRENLLKLGMNIGPVVDSTRAFYRRKLAKLLGEIKDEPAPHSSNDEGSASENERHEEEVEQVKEDLFSQLYVPPMQIKGRRSTTSSTISRSSPPKPSYRPSSTLSNAKASVVEHRVAFLCFFLGTALILYITLSDY